MKRRSKPLQTLLGRGAGNRRRQSDIALIVLVSLPSISFAHGGINALGGLQDLTTLGFIGLGLVPLLSLVWLVCSKKQRDMFVPRLLLTPIVVVGTFVALNFLYSFSKSWWILVLVIEACLMTCLLILLISKNRLWRISMLTGLGGLIVAINLAYPRLVDFYQRDHVDNSVDYPSHNFERDKYWRGMPLADGRQLFVTLPLPSELNSEDQTEWQLDRIKNQARGRSPAILLEQPDKAGYFDIIELQRTPESYITAKRVYLTLPILGQRTVLRYKPKIIGEAAELDDRLRPVEEYLREVLAVRWYDIPNGDKTLKPRQAYWAEQLMKLDFDPNYQFKSPSVPLLQTAISSRHLSAAETLIARGADIEHVNQWGSTAFHSAVFAGSPFVELLLQNGAVANQKNRSGATPLELANRYLRGDKIKRNGVFVVNTETERYRDRLKIIEMLEAHLQKTEVSD